MRSWFDGLPIARKLVAMALTVSGVALFAAVVCLTVFDALRFRTAAMVDTNALAQVIAENTAAAVVFGDAEAASDTLSSVGILPVIRRACVYDANGLVLARYTPSASRNCPSPFGDVNDWKTVSSRADVKRNDKIVGSVYVERSLADIGARIAFTAGTGVIVLALGSMLAFLLASRLQRTISAPITHLASAARAIGENQQYEVPSIRTSRDEVGELVDAFSHMVRRVRETNAEREQLLTREREASRLKDEFLAAVSHELRTPLNAILGWVQILTTTPTSPATMKRALASLGRNADAQKHVIEDLLDVSRIITGKLQMKFAETDLRSPIEAALDVVRPVAEAKSLRLRTSIPAAPCIVRGDHDRLRQVFWNLLSNSVKFTPAGGTIDVDLIHAGERYLIKVKDTGTGIAPSFVPHVFERFRQADGSMTREHGGLGLGLSIAKELTELHGGSITAESAGAGHGATFTVAIPRVAHPLSTANVKQSTGDRAPSLAALRVLVVDDDADTLEVIATLLESSGAAARAVQSGAAAIEAWQEAPYDIVLCDLAMPEMDGFELLKHLRTLEGGADARVIAVTAFVSEDHRARCLRAGFDDYIPKPLDASQLLLAIWSLAVKT